MVKYFKVSSPKLQGDMYYAAYTIEAAKREACSDFNSQIRFDITEITEFPSTSVIHCCSDLSYEDAKQVVRKLND